MKTNALTLIITLVVGVILAGSLLVPIMANYSEDTSTILNNGTYFTAADSGNHEIIIQHGSIMYDGKECIWPDLSLFGSATLLVGEDWFLRADSGTNPATDELRYLLVGPPQAFNVVGRVNPATDDKLTITIEGDSVSLTIGETTETREGLIYTISDKGAYVLSNKPYFNDSTEFYAGIQNGINAADADIYEIVSGSFEDVDAINVETCRVYDRNDQELVTISASSFTLNSSTVATDLKKLDNLSQTVTLSNDQTATITISYVIVPEKITYTNPNDIGYDSLLSVIPIMVIVALVAMAAGALYLKRDD